MGELAQFPLKSNQEIYDKKIEALSKLPRWRGTIRSRNSIRQLPDVKQGEIFWVELDHKPYIVSEINEAKNTATIRALDENATISTGITIFEMNKDIVSKEPLFNLKDEEARQELSEGFDKWIGQSMNKFLLLFGRDLHYFSLFKQEQGLKLDLFLDVLESVGKLISLDFNDDAIEIWIRTDESPAELLYLIPFDEAIIYA